MNVLASVLSVKLSRTGLSAGAFFAALAVLLLVPAIAVAVTGPSAPNDPAIITGQAQVVDGDTLDVGRRASVSKASTRRNWRRRA